MPTNTHTYVLLIKKRFKRVYRTRVKELKNEIWFFDIKIKIKIINAPYMCILSTHKHTHT